MDQALGNDQEATGLAKIWQFFVKPKRTVFEKERLGPQKFRVDPHHIFTRTDGEVFNARGNTLEYTYFTLDRVNARNLGQESIDKTCLIYLHSHGSNRSEALPLLGPMGDLGVDLMCFDFAGSGYSSGSYTTLGLWESEDLRAVIAEAKNVFGAEQIALWGRSMGAATAILFAADNPNSVEYLVLDSPFTDIEQLVRDIGNNYTALGKYLAGFFFNLVRDDIKQEIGVDLSLIRPLEACSKITIPAAFIIADGDTMVTPQRIQQMFNKMNSVQKRMLVIQGTHSSSRTEVTMKDVCDHMKPILQRNLIMKQDLLLLQSNAHENVCVGRVPVMAGIKHLKQIDEKETRSNREFLKRKNFQTYFSNNTRVVEKENSFSYNQEPIPNPVTPTKHNITVNNTKTLANHSSEQPSHALLHNGLSKQPELSNILDKPHILNDLAVSTISALSANEPAPLLRRESQFRDIQPMNSPPKTPQIVFASNAKSKLPARMSHSHSLENYQEPNYFARNIPNNESLVFPPLKSQPMSNEESRELEPGRLPISKGAKDNLSKEAEDPPLPLSRRLYKVLQIFD